MPPSSWAARQTTTSTLPYFFCRRSTKKCTAHKAECPCIGWYLLNSFLKLIYLADQLKDTAVQLYPIVWKFMMSHFCQSRNNTEFACNGQSEGNPLEVWNFANKIRCESSLDPPNFFSQWKVQRSSFKAPRELCGSTWSNSMHLVQITF